MELKSGMWNAQEKTRAEAVQSKRQESTELSGTLFAPLKDDAFKFITPPPTRQKIKTKTILGSDEDI